MELKTYKEFKAEYGNRPKDIVWIMAQRLTCQEIVNTIKLILNNDSDDTVINKLINYKIELERLTK